VLLDPSIAETAVDEGGDVGGPVAGGGAAGGEGDEAGGGGKPERRWTTAHPKSVKVLSAQEVRVGSSSLVVVDAECARGADRQQQPSSSRG